MEELIEGLYWVDFALCPRGEIYVYDRANKDLVKFCMRIGTHLDVVKKAILSRDKFIRIAVAPEWEVMKPYLLSFDPLNPDKHLFDGRWQPSYPYTQPGHSLKYPAVQNLQNQTIPTLASRVVTTGSTQAPQGSSWYSGIIGGI